MRERRALKPAPSNSFLEVEYNFLDHPRRGSEQIFVVIRVPDGKEDQAWGTLIYAAK
ncbi:MAG TPA: hypothetical protein VGN01_13590 [Acidobacteriaceae bacterium]|jgi:hypothetical protein